ncbi:DUF3806 domain-containing protein [Roseovarius aestuarii]|uniref:DUF3806 domain-containing protein n=1 Tax=Roseovarius aestuarii TaxID=475083 RepID=A0A1X7BRU7_9RHOB|nr:DUF3806 domain-containing protein [Roseovarius aestuarii]SMC12328.1 hypothetical protein ROA7745_02152 [Roseovarius aestuarii]
MKQTVSTPSNLDLERLEEQRAVVVRFVSADSLSNYQTVAGKLGTLRALLDASVFAPDQTYELQCMGIVFGDAFVQQHGFEWVSVEDEYGRDPALRFPRTSVLLFPLTMISKRIERGEAIDVFDMFNGVADIALEKVQEELKG